MCPGRIHSIALQSTRVPKLIAGTKIDTMAHRDQQSWLPSKSLSQVRRPEKPTKPMGKPGVSSYNGMRASRRARLLNALGSKTTSTAVGVKRSSQSLYDFEADKSYEDEDISSRVDSIMETLKPSYEMLSKNGKCDFSPHTHTQDETIEKTNFFHA